MDNNELLGQIAQMMETMMEKQSTELKVFIENRVNKRIDTLFDGYKLAHEKQWELERHTEVLEQQIQDLQVRLTALENKIA